MNIDRRITRIFKNVKEIPFGDQDKFVLMSDCHRGDSGWSDDFARNQNIYFSALNYYFREGYTYIELGDGDELWENRKFKDIQMTHGHVFWKLRQFYREERLILIYGNHDMVKKSPRYVEENLFTQEDEKTGCIFSLFPRIRILEGAILKYQKTGQRIFLLHGHQGDLINDQLWKVSRFLVRYFWRPLQQFGLNDPTGPGKNYRKGKKVEENLKNWAKKHQEILVAGHTHRPVFPKHGDPLYFNDGSCVHPRCITALEIEQGMIKLVKWMIMVQEDGGLYVARQVLEGPKPIDEFRTKTRE